MTGVPVLEVGGTHATAGLVLDGRVARTARRPVPAPAGADEVLAALRALVGGLGAPPAARWGVAFPGPFDYAGGVGSPEAHKFPGLGGVDVGAALGIDAVFLNDADAFALGSWADLEPHPDRLVGLCLGTGVGSGFVDRGTLVRSGPTVPPQGEVWLLDVDGRPLEDHVSRAAVRHAWVAAGGDPADDVRDVCDAARAGGPRALDVLEVAFTTLGRALAPWLAAFDADVVVVGGSVARAWDVLGPFFASTCPTPVRLSPDPERAALLGAATHVCTWSAA